MTGRRMSWIGAGVAVAVVAVFTLLRFWTWDPDYLDAWSSFFGMIATVVAAGAAIVAGIYARRAWLRERETALVLTEQRQEDRDQLVRAQADLVAGWFDAPFDDEAFALIDVLYIRNASNLPIYNVEFLLYYDSFFELDEPAIVAGGQVAQVIPPSSKPFTMEIPAKRWIVDPDGYSKADLFLHMEFSDAAGNRWARDLRGRLAARQLASDTPDSESLGT